VAVRRRKGSVANAFVGRLSAMTAPSTMDLLRTARVILVEGCARFCLLEIIFNSVIGWARRRAGSECIRRS
jgi:hypothetical protein